MAAQASKEVEPVERVGGLVMNGSLASIPRANRPADRYMARISQGFWS